MCIRDRFRTKARDLKACAMMLIANYGGRVPDTMEELLKLPGVGRKTCLLYTSVGRFGNSNGRMSENF